MGYLGDELRYADDTLVRTATTGIHGIWIGTGDARIYVSGSYGPRLQQIHPGANIKLEGWASRSSVLLRSWLHDNRWHDVDDDDDDFGAAVWKPDMRLGIEL